MGHCSKYGLDVVNNLHMVKELLVVMLRHLQYLAILILSLDSLLQLLFYQQNNALLFNYIIILCFFLRGNKNTRMFCDHGAVEIDGCVYYIKIFLTYKNDNGYYPVINVRVVASIPRELTVDVRHLSWWS